MDSKKDQPQTVEAYIAQFPEPVQAKLNQMRSIIKETAPEAEEKIAYMMPAYHLNGPLVYFGGFKNHIGFFPTPSGVEQYKEDLAGYQSSKGTIQFPLSEPIPVDLVIKIVRGRLADNQMKLEAKKTSKKKSA